MPTPKFEPHFNRAMNKQYYSEREYHSDMKKAGLEPYNPSAIKKPPVPAYARSEWAKEMHRDIINRKGRVPGDRFVRELEKRGYTQKRADEARKLSKELQ